jgi:hypothetical protein
MKRRKIQRQLRAIASNSNRGNMVGRRREVKVGFR